MLKINSKGIELIKEFEGVKLRSYQDEKGVWTIGFGHTHGVRPHQSITREEAEKLLLEDLEQFEKSVFDCVKVSVSQNEFSALVCFAYNVGLGALKSSRLLHDLNQNQKLSAADEFLRWDKLGGRSCKGLLRRRSAERSLFLEKDSALQALSLEQ